MDVSRETMDQLRAYTDLLVKWNRKINLVSRSTLDDIWNRHIADSMQVFDCGKNSGLWADLGTGAGLPGLVVSILAKEFAEGLEVVLVESDQRKSAFCRSAVRELDLPARVISERIEQTQSLKANTISARALAPLTDLLGFADHHLSEGGVCAFPKGARWKEEVDQALATWRFTYETVPSKTDPHAVILKIGDLERA